MAKQKYTIQRTELVILEIEAESPAQALDFASEKVASDLDIDQAHIFKCPECGALLTTSPEEEQNLCAVCQEPEEEERPPYEYCMGCGGDFDIDIMNLGHCPECQTDEPTMKYVCDNINEHCYTLSKADKLAIHLGLENDDDVMLSSETDTEDPTQYETPKGVYTIYNDGRIEAVS